MVDEARRSSIYAQREWDNMRAAVWESFLEEVRATAAVADFPYQAPSESLPFVLTCGAGKLHIVANRAVNVLPMYDCRSRCGWKFGMSNFSFGSA